MDPVIAIDEKSGILLDCSSKNQNKEMLILLVNKRINVNGAAEQYQCKQNNYQYNLNFSLF